MMTLRQLLGHPFVAGISTSLIAAALVFILGEVLEVISLREGLFALGGVLLASVTSFAWHRLSPQPKPGATVGLLDLWRDEAHFVQSTGLSLAERCRQFVEQTPPGQTVRMIGYDWVELLSNSNTLIPYLTGSDRLSFRVILADPDGPMVTEKRRWEMTWTSPDGVPFYPESTGSASLNRIRSKVKLSRNVAQIFEKEHSGRFQLKVTPVMPCFSILMNEDRALGQVYSLPHKGRDSLIFEVRRQPPSASLEPTRISEVYGTDIYGVLQAYFDAVWADPSWRGVRVSRLPEPR